MNILYSKIYGENNNESLVILHGLLGMSDNWITLGKKFAENYSVHLLDLRNHGRSFWDEEMNYSIMAEDLKKYMDHYNIEKINLLGHSMGGKVAMFFACKYVENIHRLMIADISPRLYPPHHRDIFEAINSIELTEITSRKEAGEILDTKIADFGTKQFILKNLYRQKDNSFAWRFHLKAIKRQIENIGEALGNDCIFYGKTLFLKGAKSVYIQVADEMLIQKHFTSASIVEIKNAGHWLHAENPLDFYEKVIEFLNS